MRHLEPIPARPAKLVSQRHEIPDVAAHGIEDKLPPPRMSVMLARGERDPLAGRK